MNFALQFHVIQLCSSNGSHFNHYQIVLTWHHLIVRTSVGDNPAYSHLLHVVMFVVVRLASLDTYMWKDLHRHELLHQSL